MSKRIDHVGITVSDLDRSLRFYCEVLGMKLLTRSTLTDVGNADLLGVDDLELTIADLDPGDGRVVELLEYSSPSGHRIAFRSWDPASMHLALTVHDLDGVQSRLQEAGVEVISRRPLTIRDPGKTWDGVRCLYVRDPDGAVLELVQHPR